MLSKLKRIKQQKPDQGFTIIEVMIVLAIAGLILLIVFLAVPALQRNARNTQRKNDVSIFLSSISTYESNNNGQTPTTCSGTNTVTIGTAGTNATSEAKMGYYQSGCSAGATTTATRVAIVTTTPAGGVAVPANSTTAPADYINVYIGGSCDTTTTGKVDSASSRSIAAQYQIETGSGAYAEQCQSS